MLVDAGPLVALSTRAICITSPAWRLSERSAIRLSRSGPRSPKPCTCWGLVARSEGALEPCRNRALTLAPLDEGDAPRMRELMEKYRDLPMDLADGALVRVAEREDLTRIFTLDRRHFSVYRPGRRRRFSILPE